MSTNPSETRRQRVLCLLEGIIDNIERSISIERDPEIELKTNVARKVLFDTRTQIVQNASHISRAFKFGSRSFGIAAEATGFLSILTSLAVVLAVISYVHVALSTNEVITKRDIYYRDVELFKSQAVVDEVLGHLAVHASVSRRHLNVDAAAKGLVRGPLSINLKDGTSIDCSSRDYSIADVEDYAGISLIDCDAIIVVEKEAVFQTLTASLCDLRSIVITGKGCNKFLSFLVNCLARSVESSLRATPILCLVDHDPHGVDILATYKFGSNAMASNVESLAISNIRWLGVHRADYKTEDTGVLSFTDGDEKKMSQLLTRQWLQAQNAGSAWQQELSHMSQARKKAEIEVISDHAGGLVKYIQDKIGAQAWI